jgi:hypothetical protein
MHPKHGTDFDALVLAVFLDFEVGLVQGSKTPPAGFGSRISEHPILVGFDGLGDHVIGGGGDFFVLVVIFDFNFGIRQRLTAQLDDALEDVAGIKISDITIINLNVIFIRPPA